MSELTVVSDSELHICPECGCRLSTGSIEFLGDGLLVVPIYCEECDFHATEEWEHSQTVRQE